MVTKPNFFLIGPPKCGTTTVAAVLSRHPDIMMSDPKEPSFFVYQGGNPYHWEPDGKDSLDWYMGLFAKAKGRRIAGDASPYYLPCNHCAAEIHRFNPDARIVTILRNPVYRAFSMYRFWHRETDHHLSQRDFIDSFHGEKLRRAFERKVEPRVGWLRGTGYYAKHLKPYFDTFPREQVKVLFYDDLDRDPRGFYQALYEHLGVDAAVGFAPENFKINVTAERRWKKLHQLMNRGYDGPVADRMKESPVGELLRKLRDAVNRVNVRPKSAELRFPQHRYAELIDVYLDDIRELEGMLAVDLEGWRSGAMR